MIGCQSTIDRPLPVRRVTPPTKTMIKMVAQVISSQTTTSRSGAVNPRNMGAFEVTVVAKVPPRLVANYLGSVHLLPWLSLVARYQWAECSDTQMTCAPESVFGSKLPLVKLPGNCLWTPVINLLGHPHAAAVRSSCIRSLYLPTSSNLL